MIEIKSVCGHYKDCLKGIMMRALYGELLPPLAIVCPDCGKILFYVREHEERQPRRRSV